MGLLNMNQWDLLINYHGNQNKVFSKSSSEVSLELCNELCNECLQI